MKNKYSIILAAAAAFVFAAALCECSAPISTQRATDAGCDPLVPEAGDSPSGCRGE